MEAIQKSKKTPEQKAKKAKRKAMVRTKHRMEVMRTVCSAMAMTCSLVALIHIYWRP